MTSSNGSGAKPAQVPAAARELSLRIRVTWVVHEHKPAGTAIYYKMPG